MRVVFGEGFGQVADTLGVGADALSDAEEVGGGNLHVAAFGAGLRVVGLRVEEFHLEEVLEDGLVDEGLALAHLEAHRVDEYAVVDRRGGVAGEEEVVERLQQVAVVGILGVPAGVLVALDEDGSELLGVEVEELRHQLRAAVHAAALAHEVLADGGLLEEALEDILHIVDVGPFVEHTAEIVVFAVHDGLVEDVAVERFGGVEGRHAFDFGSRTVEKDGAEASGLRGDVDVAGGDIFIIVIHI